MPQFDWIPISKELPADGQYVLGAFEGTYDDGTPFKLVFAMWYDRAERVFKDCDGVARSATTDERIVYWAPIPEYPI